jgi:hypothetical protein
MLQTARGACAHSPWKRTVHSDTCVMQRTVGLLVIAGQRAAAGAAGAAAAGSRARAGGAARFPAGCHGGDGCSYTLRCRGGWAAAGAGSQPQQPGAAVIALCLDTKRSTGRGLEHTKTCCATVVCLHRRSASFGRRTPSSTFWSRQLQRDPLQQPQPRAVLAGLSRSCSLPRSSWHLSCREPARWMAAAKTPTVICRTHMLRCSRSLYCSSRYCCA